MRIAFLVFNLNGMGGTERSVITQANALAHDHDVRVISVVRQQHRSTYAIDPRVQVDYLADTVPKEPPVAHHGPRLDESTTAALAERPSILVPERWDRQFSALTDVVLEAYLPRLQADVLVSVTPALLSAAVQLAPGRTALVHQEHRSSSDRTAGMECLLAFAPRADLVACLTTSMADWLRKQLGPVSPEIIVMPNPLPVGVTPRSNLDQPLIVSGGRLVLEKQFGKLIRAFGDIAGEIPDWRLRILGSGPQLADLKREVRRSRLWDRVELPGPTTNMQSEWARASICALTSRAEGLPLVVQEAMAAGVPVASFDCPAGPRELIEHETNSLLVPPESVAGLSAALLRLATDDALRRKLGAAALQSAQEYAPARIADRWVEHFRSLDRPAGGRLAQRVRAMAASPPADPKESENPSPPGDATPGSLRTDILRTLAHVADACTDDWFVLPASDDRYPAVVVPREQRDKFLQILGERDLPDYLCLVDPGDHSWPVRRGRGRELIDYLRRGQTQRMTVEPWPTTRVSLFTKRVRERPTAYQACAVDVEFWDADPEGDLVAPRLNPYVTRAPGGGASRVTTVVDSVEVPTLAPFEGSLVDRCDFPIDVVYTWVDGSDPEWDAARERRLREVGVDAMDRTSSGRARFESRDELRYSMRSIHAFAPWVRNIHLVTAGQVPPWLDTDHPRVRVVDHREILPEDALPTFNSHAIETALHRVPDLTEHFVYFNDDMMVGRPVQPEQLFTPGGLPTVIFSGHPIGTPSDAAPPFLQAATNNRQLLRDAFGVAITRTLAHTPYPHRRSTLAEIEERFAADVSRTARSPFRSNTDVSMLSSLAQHYGLITGSAVEGSVQHEFVNLGSSDLASKLRRLLERDNDFLCVGDIHDLSLSPGRLVARLTEFLECYYPTPAPWETEPGG